MDERLEFSGEGEEQDPLKLNYYALVISIMTGFSPERAFSEVDPHNQANRHLKYFEADLMNMEEMREQGMTYNEIGKVYRTNRDHAYRLLRDYRKRKESGGE